MRQPTLAETDMKIHESLIEAKKTRQSWFSFDREESKHSPIIWYSLYKSGKIWVKLSIADKNGKVDFNWDIPPILGDTEVDSVLAIYQSWSLGFLFNVPIPPEADNDSEQKVEFECSQDELYKTIRNLDAQSLIKPYALGDFGTPDIFGYTKILIHKGQLHDLSIEGNTVKGVHFEEVGYITIGSVTSKISILQIRSNNPELFYFFNLLINVLSEYGITVRKSSKGNKEDDKSKKSKKKIVEKLSKPKSSKRGRKTKSESEKIRALRDWDELDKSVVTLREFLDQRFGLENDYVAEPTFHGWRRDLRKKGIDI